MRRDEITPELIELSKQAKKLGFPQDVKEGDWIYSEQTQDLFLIGDERLSTGCVACQLIPYFFLILEFSRCLEWLDSRDKICKVAIKAKLEVLAYFYWFMAGDTSLQQLCEKGAKAVVKILEEEG